MPAKQLEHFTPLSLALGNNLGINLNHNLIYRRLGVVQVNRQGESDIIIRRIFMSASIKCPQCGKMMQSDAKVCGFCSYDLQSNQPASRQKNSLKGCFAIIILALLAILILVGISSIVSEGPAPAVSMQ